MKFGPVRPEDSEGAILAHTVRFGGKVIRKGKRLNASDIGALSNAGVESVVVARLEATDVHEDEAARLIATAAAGPGLTVSRPANGRSNLSASASGLALLDRDRIHRINAIDEGVTLATVQPFARVEPGDLVATVKIIPFAVGAENVEAAREAVSAADRIVGIAPFLPRRVGLLQSVLPEFRTSLVEKMATTTRDRIASLGGEFHDAGTCAHREDAVADTLGTMARDGCEIALVLGASAIVDRRDVVPAALVEAGGEILHFGMPVDPGNLMLLGRLGGMHVLGLPGSARSPRLHGFDWVLERLMAGLEVGPDDIRAMGVGGLLKEIPSRPMPRRIREAAPAKDAPSPRVAALVLAAGQSRRMGPTNKLLAEIDGTPMVRRVVETLLTSRADPVLVAVGHEADQVRAALTGCAVEFVDNPDYAEGLSASLRHGLAVVPRTSDGLLVCLGDMPRISAATIDHLIDAFDPGGEAGIVVPVHRGKRGNPVLWARRFFKEMGGIAGDVGAKHLIGRNADAVREVEMDEDDVLVDIDSPDALAAIRRE